MKNIFFILVFLVTFGNFDQALAGTDPTIVISDVRISLPTVTITGVGLDKVSDIIIKSVDEMGRNETREPSGCLLLEGLNDKNRQNNKITHTFNDDWSARISKCFTNSAGDKFVGVTNKEGSSNYFKIKNFSATTSATQKAKTDSVNRTSKKRAKTTLELTSPAAGDIIQLGKPIELEWNYTKAPKNTQVVYSITLATRTPSTKNPVLGGGDGSTVKALKKKGSGSVTWETGKPGSGHTDIPGTYIVSASIRDCHPNGCGYNADFPGLNLPIRTYASATPVTVTLVEKAVSEKKSASNSAVKLLAPLGGTYKAGDSLTIVWENKQLTQGTKVCTFLQSESGKLFTFPGSGGNCSTSTTYGAVQSMTGTIIQQQGYNLAAGKYRALLQVQIPDKTVSAGKEGGTVKNVVGGWFEVL